MKDYEIHKIKELEDFYWWFIARRELALLLIKQYCHSDVNLRILDVGCGTGRLMKDLSSRFSQISSVDISSSAVDYCRKGGFNNVYQEDAVNMHFPSESFDCVSALDLFEHIGDDNQAFLEVFRVLKHKGILVFTVPANKYLWSYHDIALEHKRRYTIADLKNKLIFAGFKIEKMTYCITGLFLPIFIFRMLQKYFFKSVIPRTTIIILPWFINILLLFSLRFENLLIKKGVNFPFGVSIVGVVAKS